MLGYAQLSRYDNEVNNNNEAIKLDEAEKSFRTSLELEGKPSGGKEVPALIQDQQWWKARQATKTKEMSSTSNEVNTPKKDPRVSPTKTTGRGRGKIISHILWCCKITATL